ncbi:FecR domain-containing protein [Myxococcota bacterium]
MVVTEEDSSVTLYLSDGSITYLDANTTLQLLPESDVLQNDDRGITTRVRLKLLLGKIWDKVARLASESEFNVETTSAIAGVRGTEFGIDAAGSELIVFSGQVAARQMTAEERELAADGETPLSMALHSGASLSRGEIWAFFRVVDLLRAALKKAP